MFDDGEETIDHGPSTIGNPMMVHCRRSTLHSIAGINPRSAEQCPFGADNFGWDRPAESPDALKD